jgi:hypothetical protein
VVSFAILRTAELALWQGWDDVPLFNCSGSWSTSTLDVTTLVGKDRLSWCGSSLRVNGRLIGASLFTGAPFSMNHTMAL